MDGEQTTNKPLSLADRIALQKKENINPEKIAKEQELMSTLGYNGNLDNSPTQRFRNLATQQLDNSATQQAPKQVTKQLPEQLPKQATQQVGNLAGRQLDNLTTRQLGNSATKQDEGIAFDPGPIFDPRKKPDDLKLVQFRVLFEIYFQRPFKVSGESRVGGAADFPIPYGTVRYCLDSLVRKGYIGKPFPLNNGVWRGSSCQVNESKCFPLFGKSSIINSEQIDNRFIQQFSNSATQQPGSLSSKQLSNPTIQQDDSFYKKDRQILNKNLSVFLEQSDFWRRQGLTAKKLQDWITEIDHCDPDYLLQQLQFGEAHNLVIKARNPVNYLYRAIKDKGGITKPEGFEYPEERALRLKKDALEAKQKVLEELQQIEAKQLLIDQTEAFEEALKDPEIVQGLIDQIEKGHVTPKKQMAIKKFKSTGEINTMLKKALEFEFMQD